MSHNALFKVWSSDRKHKLTFMASNVDDLKQKCCDKLKLSIDGSECQLVDEADGSCVDDDDVLSAMSGHVFLLLQPGEMWTPAQMFSPNYNSLNESSTISAAVTSKLPGVDNFDRSAAAGISSKPVAVAEPLLPSLTSELTQCGICKSDFIDPRILPCNHTFCLKCLDICKVSHGQMSCPECGVQIEVHSGGLVELPRNTFIPQFLLIRNGQMYPSTDSDATQIVDQACTVQDEQQGMTTPVVIPAEYHSQQITDAKGKAAFTEIEGENSSSSQTEAVINSDISTNVGVAEVHANCSASDSVVEECENRVSDNCITENDLLTVSKKHVTNSDVSISTASSSELLGSSSAGTSDDICPTENETCNTVSGSNEKVRNLVHSSLLEDSQTEESDSEYASADEGDYEVNEIVNRSDAANTGNNTSEHVNKTISETHTALQNYNEDDHNTMTPINISRELLDEDSECDVGFTEVGECETSSHSGSAPLSHALSISDAENCHTTEDLSSISVLNVSPDCSAEKSKSIHSQATKSTGKIVKLASLMGGVSRSPLGQKEYYRVCSIHPRPQYKPEERHGFVGKTLPYLMQRIKMRGCHVLHASNIAGLTQQKCQNKWVLPRKRASNFRGKALESSASDVLPNVGGDEPISRLDCITCMLNVANTIIASDLLLVMSQFPIALPLIMRWWKREQYILMSPVLRGIIVKWETNFESIIEHSLFIDPLRLIVAVRLGNNAVGKSTILNQLLAREYTFSSVGEPGSEYGKPLSLNGTVEFVCLTRETVKDSVWESTLSEFYSKFGDAIALLANLHGDANAYMHVLKLLKQYSCRFLVFVMPDCEEQNWNKFLTNHELTTDDVCAIYVDPDPFDPNDHEQIQSSQLAADSTMCKVRHHIEQALVRCSTYSGGLQETMTDSRIRLAQDASARNLNSLPLINLVKNETCKSTKSVMQFQSKWYRNKEARRILRSNKQLQRIVDCFLMIFQSSAVEELQTCILELENELSRLSNRESMVARQEICALKAKLYKTQPGTVCNKADIEQLAAAFDQLDSTNLGLEHFIREIAQIYSFTAAEKIVIHKMSRKLGRIKSNRIIKLPGQIAELFVNGQPVELLNGDACDIPMTWFNAVCASVDKIKPKLRVFVVSILGLQSSGKSTLLNSLFACRFAVSVGRCTRGLFMRLLFLEDSLAKSCNFDVILLIDTEGLGSPEKMNVASAEKKDRLLATFAMGISNLVVINVLGEYMKELTEILQIAILTMTRLEKADIAPDMLMVQHLLTEKNSDKTIESQGQFCDAIRSAVDLSEKKDIQCGVRNAKCLDVLFERIQNGTLLKQFHPFKDGATVNSPPSKAYHEDVVDLFQKILEAGKSSTNLLDFKKWHELVEGYWECVNHEDFALRFKNVKDVYEFIERGDRIATVKKAFGAAFSQHANCLCESILASVNAASSDADQRESVLLTIGKELTQVPAECTNCQLCEVALGEQRVLYQYIEGTPHEIDTKKTIEEHRQRLCESTTARLVQKLEALIVQQECSCEFIDIINRHLKLKLEHCPAGKFNDQAIRDITKEIFGKIQALTATKDAGTPVRQRIIEELRSEYRRVMPDMIQQFDKPQLSFEKAVLSSGEGKCGIFMVVKSIKTFLFGPEQLQDMQLLEGILSGLPHKILEQQKSECYEDGMVGILHRKINEEFKRFRGRSKTLTSAQKITAHIWAQQTFCKEMEAIQNVWDSQHKPALILQQQSQRYMQIIEARLRCGFSSAGDGQIVAKDLLDAIRAVAVRSENDEVARAVKGIIWTTSSEKVRLKYFEELALEVVRGFNDRALGHFRNPRKQIEEWYNQHVDGFRQEPRGTIYRKTLENEFAHVLRMIDDSKNAQELVTSVKSYIEKQGLPFSFDVSKAQDQDHKVLMSTITKTLTDSKQDVLQFHESMFRQPSKDPDVMALLGCTHRCHWCGALCWGQRGHEENSDDTKKHHSSHHPQGLIGTHDKNTNVLVSRSCNNTPDSTKVCFGEYLECGLDWGTAKEKHFSDWKFDRHHNNKFDQLMRWFFAELHQYIARKYDLLPAKDDDLERDECQELDIDDILERINTAVN